MQGSYEVAVAALVQHAKTLGGLEAELRSASDTAKGATVSADSDVVTRGTLAVVC